MNLRQKVDDRVGNFIKRFRKMADKYLVQFLESQYTSMSITRMHPQLKENMVGEACVDLYSLASRVVQIEQFIQLKEKRREEPVEAGAHT